MTEHYYTHKPSTTSNPQNINFTLRGNVLQFKSDRGVFSKNEVDFGSRLLIETFQIPTIEGDLLDVGCGYGPIGLALAKDCPTRTVEMIDVNERAIDLAKQNAANNQISNVEIYQSDIFTAVDQEKRFAAILSNPPIRAGKKVVHQILEESYRYLHPKGELWIVIQKKQGAPSAIEKLESIFDEVEIVERDKGYYIIKASRG